MGNQELKKQIELLGNNIETIEIPNNYLKQAKVELDEIEKGVSRLKENLNYAMRGNEVVKEGFEAVKEDMENILESN